MVMMMMTLPYFLVACILVLGVIQVVTSETTKKRTGTGPVGRRTGTVPRRPVPQVPDAMVTNTTTVETSQLLQPGFPNYLGSERIRNNSGVGCKELRSKRFVSDGYCRSLRPLTEVVCSGFCLPARDLPWYTDVVRTWGGAGTFEWRCVDGAVRKKRVTLACDDGTSKAYRVKVVQNCRCRRGNYDEEEGHPSVKEGIGTEEEEEEQRRRAVAVEGRSGRDPGGRRERRNDSSLE